MQKITQSIKIHLRALSILELLQYGDAYSKKQISKLLNLNHSNLWKNLDILTRAGLVEQLYINDMPPEERRKYRFNAYGLLVIYRITEKGKEFVQKWIEFRDAYKEAFRNVL